MTKSQTENTAAGGTSVLSAGLDIDTTYHRPPSYYRATADYIELLEFAKMEFSVAVLYEEFLKLGLPVMFCDVDLAATKIAGHRVFHYKINEALMEILAAARVRAGEREYRESQGVKDGHDDSSEISNVRVQPRRARSAKASAGTRG
ncbi:MAG: hypothetical protein HY525_09800 [Betaproteobacteria bacterium]|nr:hypothetical protein [Betaproteobacteria bacterium]